jgi:hypothetical protein
LLCQTEHFVQRAKELPDELSQLYIKHATEVHAMQLSNDMEPVGVVSNFPRKIGLYGGASVAVWQPETLTRLIVPVCSLMTLTWSLQQ